MRLLGLLTLLVGLAVSPVMAQDAVVADAKYHKVEFENDQVRVVRYTIPPGAKTAMHEHPTNVQIMLTDHNVKVTTPDGKTTEAHGKAGTSAWRTPTKHLVENIGDKPIEGILVEPKTASK
jgi:beta-alanine degradation protein BauB